jgi:hypothetical protein
MTRRQNFKKKRLFSRLAHCAISGAHTPNKIGSSAKNYGICHLKIGSSRNIHQNNWWLCKQVGRSQEKHETTL